MEDITKTGNLQTVCLKQKIFKFLLLNKRRKQQQQITGQNKRGRNTQMRRKKQQKQNPKNVYYPQPALCQPN